MSDQRFGECCATLNALMHADEFSPTIYEDDGRIYLTVGFAPSEDGDLGMYDHALSYCPFCGSRLQTEEDIEERGISATIQ